MPWDLRKQGDEYVVVKQGTDEVMGRHALRSDALAQMRALYANVNDAADGGFQIRDGLTGEVVATVATDELDAFAVHDFLANTKRIMDAFSADDMRKMMANGTAFKKDDGTPAYPTPNMEYWHKALQAFGRSDPKERGRLKAYLKRRGEALGAAKEEIARIDNYSS